MGEGRWSTGRQTRRRTDAGKWQGPPAASWQGLPPWPPAPRHVRPIHLRTAWPCRPAGTDRATRRLWRTGRAS
eukprot:5775729-Alexandrium_andersonii.AAC.1